MIRAYAAVGTIYVMLEPNNWVPTKTANVPFCRPHSKDIHLRWATPEAKNLAI